MNATQAFPGAAQNSQLSNETQCESSVERAAHRKALENAIRSTDPVIEGHETVEDWLEHRETVIRELCPVGALETAYAQRAALYLWRLDRVIRYEITATQFDLEDVIQEFIHSLDHPDLPRDRSEAVTLEKIRAPLGDFLKQFAKWGEVAAKLPGQKEGMADVRGEIKRIKERRILPDQPTVQTIIKYESHLQRCLAGTMAELRRLQKERRQGLRVIDEVYTDRHVGDTCGTPAPADFTKLDPANGSNLDHKHEDTGGTPASADFMNSKHVDHTEIQSPDRLESVNQPATHPESGTPVPIQSPAGIESVDQPIQTLTINGHRISEATPNGMITHQKNASGVLITMFPKTQYSAVPSVVVRTGPGPIATESHIHQKE